MNADRSTQRYRHPVTASASINTPSLCDARFGNCIVPARAYSSTTGKINRRGVARVVGGGGLGRALKPYWARNVQSYCDAAR